MEILSEQLNIWIGRRGKGCRFKRHIRALIVLRSRRKRRHGSFQFRWCSHALVLGTQEEWGMQEG